MDFSVKLNQQLLELIINDKSGMAAVEKANAFYENCKALRAENFNADLQNYVKKLGELDAIKEYYGYNNNALDKKKIDGFYETLPVPDEWTLITMMQFEERAAWFVQHMDLMGEPALEPAMPLRAFNGGNKLIAISLGMIAAPFYNPNWPLEFHYAGIGQIIAHELTHSFDEQVFSERAEFSAEV
ncbi:unnamed protein product, partial [Mesorhabditis spiculigera]